MTGIQKEIVLVGADMFSVLKFGVKEFYTEDILYIVECLAMLLVPTHQRWWHHVLCL